MKPYPKNQPYFAYLVDCISNDDAAPEGNTERVAYIFERIQSECGWNVERIGEQRAIAEWLQGLAIAIPFYDHDILELARKIGNLKPTATESQERRVVATYWPFMATKLICLRNWHERQEVKA